MSTREEYSNSHHTQSSSHLHINHHRKPIPKPSFFTRILVSEKMSSSKQMIKQQFKQFKAPAAEIEPKVTFGVEMEFVLAVPKTQLPELDRGLQKRLDLKLQKKLERVDESRLDRQLETHYREGLFEYAAEQLNAQPAMRHGVYNSYTSSKDLDYSQWNLVQDSSIEANLLGPQEPNMMRTLTSGEDLARAGMELVSPIFYFAEKKTWMPKLLQIESSLKDAAYANKSTGLHVHLGLESDPGLELPTLKALALLWAISEQAIETIHPPHRHGENNFWCKSLLNRIEAAPDRATKLVHLAFYLVKAENLAQIQSFTGGSLSKMNISKATEKKKITVEFREHAGTLAADDIQRWVNFCQKMLLHSVKMAARTSWTKDEMLQMFEDLTDLGYLMELIGLEEVDKQYFLRRQGKIAAARYVERELGSRYV